MCSNAFFKHRVAFWSESSDTSMFSTLSFNLKRASNIRTLKHCTKFCWPNTHKLWPFVVQSHKWTQIGRKSYNVRSFQSFSKFTTWTPEFSRSLSVLCNRISVADCLAAKLPVPESVMCKHNAKWSSRLGDRNWVRKIEFVTNFRVG